VTAQPGNPPGTHPALVTITGHRDAVLRLFCFPPAGTGPAFFLPWAPLLPPGIELVTFSLPGRGSHPSHLSTTDPRRLVRELTSLIPADNPGGFGFFGHSIGALLAFETTRQLRRGQSRAPDLLAISGLPAPQTETLQANIVSGALAGLAGRGDLTSLLPDDTGITTHRKVAHYAPVIADSLLILHYRYHRWTLASPSTRASQTRSCQPKRSWPGTTWSQPRPPRACSPEATYTSPSRFPRSWNS
jgi:surfactin synthase thioesterase subunit